MIDEDNLDMYGMLFNKIHENNEKCSDYRLLSLMNHALKVYLKTIHHRIYKKCEVYKQILI